MKSEKLETGGEFWFVAGSQRLYGPDALRQVAAHAEEVARELDASSEIPGTTVFKGVGESAEAIRRICLEANASPECAGLIVWCHTFSPARMWIGGLGLLGRPLLHLHTQYSEALPWASIDMDYMNLHQSAHGDREFGFACSRLRLERKVVAGSWRSVSAQRKIGAWSRAALAWRDWQGARFCRFGDNMREVAVTEGDKVAAEARFGFSVNGYGVGDLAERVQAASDEETDRLCRIYDEAYKMAPELRPDGERRASLRDAARIELGLRSFLEDGGFKGFTTTFEDLRGLSQLPGLAAQRLMAEGYGFGAEGDWKTAAFLRLMKVMGASLPGGVSFMEDYTYHIDGVETLVLGAHMLEICESIAAGKPSCEVHPLGIGGKEDPARLVFDVAPGPALNATLVDLGDRFRLVANEIEVVAPPEPLPKLPVARAVWKPLPDFETAACSWIHAGGSHHPVFSQNGSLEELEDFASIAGIELVSVDRDSTVSSVRDRLRWNEAAYRNGGGRHYAG